MRISMRKGDKQPKQEKFDFEKMKSAATSPDPVVRKQIFVEYFTRFQEFPSYLFDNEPRIDERLFETIHDLRADPDTPKEMLRGIEILIDRLTATGFA